MSGPLSTVDTASFIAPWIFATAVEQESFHPDRNSGVMIFTSSKHREWICFTFLRKNQLKKGNLPPGFIWLNCKERMHRECEICQHYLDLHIEWNCQEVKNCKGKWKLLLRIVLLMLVWRLVLPTPGKNRRNSTVHAKKAQLLVCLYRKILISNKDNANDYSDDDGGDGDCNEVSNIFFMFYLFRLHFSLWCL